MSERDSSGYCITALTSFTLNSTILYICPGISKSKRKARRVSPIMDIMSEIHYQIIDGDERVLIT